MEHTPSTPFESHFQFELRLEFLFQIRCHSPSARQNPLHFCLQTKMKTTNKKKTTNRTREHVSSVERKKGCDLGGWRRWDARAGCMCRARCTHRASRSTRSRSRGASACSACPRLLRPRVRARVPSVVAPVQPCCAPTRPALRACTSRACPPATRTSPASSASRTPHLAPHPHPSPSRAAPSSLPAAKTRPRAHAVSLSASAPSPSSTSALSFAMILHHLQVQQQQQQLPLAICLCHHHLLHHRQQQQQQPHRLRQQQQQHLQHQKKKSNLPHLLQTGSACTTGRGGVHSACSLRLTRAHPASSSRTRARSCRAAGACCLRSCAVCSRVVARTTPQSPSSLPRTLQALCAVSLLPSTPTTPSRRSCASPTRTAHTLHPRSRPRPPHPSLASTTRGSAPS